MEFIKRLLGKKSAPVEPMRGGQGIQTQAEQDVTRQDMESEMAEQRERRESAETKPPDESQGGSH